MVRRVSGGSAVYTDSDQLIYGLACRDVLPEGKEEAFSMVCGALIIALEQLGIPAEYKPINDILVRGEKISGSAQMRKWGIVLQHGTLILDLDRDMMFGALKADHRPLPSLNEVSEKRHDVSTVKQALVHGFQTAFDIEIEPQK